MLLVTAASSDYVTDVVDGLTATGMVGTITTFDGGSGTPTPADLTGIDVVMAMSDGSWQDHGALGDLLADFVDSGGRVVETVFTLYCGDDSSGLGGRWASGGYGALVGPNPDCPSQINGDGPITMVPVDGASPLLASVTSFNGGTSSYRNDVVVAAGATLVANWNDEGPTPFEAWTDAHAGCVVGLNFYPPSSTIREDFWDASTDGWIMQANALNFDCAATPPPPVPEEPTAAPEVVLAPAFTG